jgi:excisionase family DNA binding protein
MMPADAATPSRFMTTAEAARYLRIDRSALYKLVGKGQIPAFKIFRDYRFDRDAIDKWMIYRQVRLPS